MGGMGKGGKFGRKQSKARWCFGEGCVMVYCEEVFKQGQVSGQKDQRGFTEIPRVEYLPPSLRTQPVLTKRIYTHTQQQDSPKSQPKNRANVLSPTSPKPTPKTPLLNLLSYFSKKQKSIIFNKAMKIKKRGGRCETSGFLTEHDFKE